MATSKSMTLHLLKISCDHNGGTEYWCQECAYVAASLLREENARLAARVESLKKPRGEK